MCPVYSWGQIMKTERLTDEQWSLVRENTGYAVWWAARLWENWGGRSAGIVLDDLVEEARAGLMDAATRFDPSLGNRFTAYARLFVVGRIRRAMRSRGRSRALRHDPADGEQVRRPPASPTPDGGIDWHDPRVIRKVAGAFRAGTLDIDDREYEALAIRHALRGGRPAIQARVAFELGVSVATARKVERSAMEKLRAVLES